MDISKDTIESVRCARNKALLSFRLVSEHFLKRASGLGFIEPDLADVRAMTDLLSFVETANGFLR